MELKTGHWRFENLTFKVRLLAWVLKTTASPLLEKPPNDLQAAHQVPAPATDGIVETDPPATVQLFLMFTRTWVNLKLRLLHKTQPSCSRQSSLFPYKTPLTTTGQFVLLRGRYTYFNLSSDLHGYVYHHLLYTIYSII